MKLLFEFFPIVAFFIVYKFFGIYTATAVTMVAYIVQITVFWIKYHRFEKLHLIALASVLVLGGATLLLHDTLFIKWKPTALYWIFSLVFLISQFAGKKTIIERLMNSQITLPSHVWQRLNLSWVIFFGLMGFINLYIAYHFSTNFWVNFKLSTIGIILVFGLAQAFFMAKYLNVDKPLEAGKPVKKNWVKH